MKTTPLIKLSKASFFTPEKQTVKRKKLTIDELNENDAIVAKLWDMYQNQLRRTHEMMLLYETQRMELEKTKEILQELEFVRKESDKSQRKERDKPLRPISFVEVEKLGKYLKEALYISKSSYAYALIKMLYTLNQLNGKATAAQLFTSSEITEVSGFRYAQHLKGAHMILYSPTENKGYYEITDIGRKFLKGEIQGRQDFDKILIDFGYMQKLVEFDDK